MPHVNAPTIAVCHSPLIAPKLFSYPSKSIASNRIGINLFNPLSPESISFCLVSNYWEPFPRVRFIVCPVARRFLHYFILYRICYEVGRGQIFDVIFKSLGVGFIDLGLKLILRLSGMEFQFS